MRAGFLRRADRPRVATGALARRDAEIAALRKTVKWLTHELAKSIEKGNDLQDVNR